MPRKRRLPSSPDSEGPPRKKRRLPPAEEEKEESDSDIEMDNTATTPQRNRWANGGSAGTSPSRPIGGIINGRSADEFRPEFQRGAIRTVTVKNWVTFDSAQITAVPGLNLIMGPNGTGKSSLICAICMGLNGKTQTLGRVDRISDFIKRGETRASIEIVLHQGNPDRQTDVTIERVVTKRSSTWKINKKDAKAGAVSKLVQSLNIKVDNLCQFLAQDRVVEFARLNAQDLLLETERAVDGDNVDLLRTHKALIELQKDVNSQEAELKTVEASLSAAQEELRGLENVISNFRSREQMRNKLEVVESRVAWKAVEDNEGESKTFEVEVNRLKMKLRAEEKELRPLRNRITSWHQKENRLKTTATKLEAENRKVAKQYKTLEGKYAQFSPDMKEERAKVKEAKKRAGEQAKKIAKLQNDMLKLEEQFEGLEDASHIQEQLRGIREKIKELRKNQLVYRNQHRKIQSDRDGLQNELVHLEDRIRNLQDSDRRRAEQIYRGRKSKLRQFRAWVESNRHEFQEQVYGPIVAHMNVDNELHAAYLNTAISENILYAWVTSDKKDWARLSRESKKQGMNVIVLQSEGDELRNHLNISRCSRSTLERNGASGFLDEVFEAPEVIKCVLCDQANIHQVAYSNDNLSAENREALLASSNRDRDSVRTLFEPSQAWSVKISRYDGEAATSSRPIRRPRDNEPGLRITQDVSSDISQARAQWDSHTRTLKDFGGQIAAIQEQEKPITQEINQLNQNKAVWQEKQSKFKKLKNQMKRTESKLRAENEPIDVVAYEERCRVNIKAMLTSQIENVEYTIRAVSKLVEIQINFREAVTQREHARVERVFVEQQSKKLATRQKNLKIQLKDAQRNLQTALRRFEGLLNNAESRYPRENWEEKWDDALRGMTGEELEANSEDLKSRIACVLCNQSDVNRYKKLEKDVQSFQERLTNSTDASRKVKEQLRRMEEQWRPRLREMVEKISKRFSELFIAFKANGRVELAEDEAYDKWAIEIMTQFRAEQPMQRLSGHAQSGGERSVSTMLYLLALQEVTTAPFRVVDEINQGMDPKNERLIMDILNRECVPKANREVPQYFVVSPKLLPRLQYSAHSAAFLIFNGPWVAPQSMWDMNSFITNRRQSQSSQRR